MKKTNMLRKRKDFGYVYRKGKKFGTPILGLYVVNSKYNIRAGFSVSKKIGNSVCRNKIKRRLKESFTEILPTINYPSSYVFIARQKIIESSYKDIKLDMENLIKRTMKK